MDDKRFIFGWLPITYLFYAVVVVIAVFVIGGGGYLGYTKFIAKAQRNAETEVIRSSNQFIDSKQSLLLSLIDEHADLETEKARFSDDAQLVENLSDQQEAIVDRVCEEKSKIDAQWVPRDVSKFVLTHPCYGS